MNYNNEQSKKLAKESTEKDIFKDICCEDLEINFDDNDNVIMEWLLWCYDDTYEYAGSKSGILKEAGVSFDEVINNDDNFMNMYLSVKRNATGSFEPTITVCLETDKGYITKPLEITTDDGKNALLNIAESYVCKEDNKSMEELFIFYETENLIDDIYRYTNDSVNETANYINEKMRNTYYTDNKYLSELIVQQDLFNRLAKDPQPLYQKILNEYKDKKFNIDKFLEIYNKSVHSLIEDALHSGQRETDKEQLANMVFNNPFNDKFSLMYDYTRCPNGVVLSNYINIGNETLTIMLDYLYDHYPIVAEKLSNKFDFNIKSKEELLSHAEGKDVVAECRIDFTRPDLFNICVGFETDGYSVVLPAVISSDELPDKVKASIIEAANENIRNDYGIKDSSMAQIELIFTNANTLSELFTAINEYNKSNIRMLEDKIFLITVDRPDITQDAEGTVEKKYKFTLELPDEVKEDYITRFGIFSYNGSPNETERSCKQRNKELINRFELTLTMNVIYTEEPCSTVSLQANLHNGIPKYDDGSFYVSKGGGLEKDGFDASTLAVYDFTGYVPLSVNEQQMYKEKAEKAISDMSKRLQKQDKYR